MQKFSDYLLADNLRGSRLYVDPNWWIQKVIVNTKCFLGQVRGIFLCTRVYLLTTSSFKFCLLTCIEPVLGAQSTLFQEVQVSHDNRRRSPQARLCRLCEVRVTPHMCALDGLLNVHVAWSGSEVKYYISISIYQSLFLQCQISRERQLYFASYQVVPALWPSNILIASLTAQLLQILIRIGE